MSDKKNISILGSTGSIGTQALSVIRENKDLNVSALVCGRNTKLMEKQIREFNPQIAVVWDEKDAKDLKVSIADTKTKVFYGMDGIKKAASQDGVDTVLAAMVGMIGIEPVIEAIKAKKTIALANKETLVCAGDIIMPMVKDYGVLLLPVDSEHSAIFQSLEGRHENSIKKILLTASGGPFFGKRKEELLNVTAKDALKHPNWDMGAKITIDSATMVNKGLEVMEACHLFGVNSDLIEVLVHRQSILHSAVEYEDGAVIGQLGLPDMKIPIAYALLYPERRLVSGKRLSLCDVGKLTFEKPDLNAFKGLALSFEAIRQGGNMPAVFNAANELAVAGFLAGDIGFLEIPKIIERAMETVGYVAKPCLSDILETMEQVKDSLF